MLEIARSRLLHFIVLGGLLFAFMPGPPSRHIRLPHTPGGDDQAIENEVLYREALRLGLDRDDDIVRQRLIQKVLFLAEDLSAASRPVTDEQVAAYYQSHAALWRQPASVELVHVFARSRDALEPLRARLTASPSHQPESPPALGDPFPLPRKVFASSEAISSTYGAPFAAEVAALAPGAWSRPLASSYGWHLVKVLARTDAAPARFEDVRKSVELAYLRERKTKAVAAFLADALGRYRIDVGGVPYRPGTALGTSALAAARLPSGD